MAIVKITAPLATAPNVFAAPVIAHNQSHVIDCNHGPRFKSGYVCEGARFNIGGTLFVADADTAISGTETSALLVKFVVTGDSASASYVSSWTGVTWNGANQGYYDVSGNYYIEANPISADLVMPGCIIDKLLTVAESSSYVKVAEIRVPVTGWYNVKYTANEDGNSTGYVRVYKDGDAYGTEHELTSNSAFTDITDALYFIEGELAQVYYKNSWGGAQVGKFALCNSVGSIDWSYFG